MQIKLKVNSIKQFEHVILALEFSMGTSNTCGIPNTSIMPNTSSVECKPSLKLVYILRPLYIPQSQSSK